VKAIEELRPKYVLIENVPEMLNTRILISGEWVYIDDYLREKLGDSYSFNGRKVVNAMNYGVAQSRERCIYLLSRKDMSVRWEFPAPHEFVTTMRDAIGDLPSLDPDVTDISEEERLALFPDYYKKKEAGLKVSKWHYPPRHKIRHVIAMQHTPEGCSAWFNDKYYPTLADGSKSKGYKNTYKRQWWDKPAYTVTKYTSRLGSQENGHPGRPINDYEDEERRLWSDARVLSIFELMRVSSLPDDWNIPDWATPQLIRQVIGEGIPPLLIKKLVAQLNLSTEANE
jgi:DNA (cytosine-5)-methyltransferase 1